MVAGDYALVDRACRRSLEGRGSAVGLPTGPPGHWWTMNVTILTILAVVLAVVGVVQLLQGQIVFGIVLLVLAALVGPGGYSLTRPR